MQASLVVATAVVVFAFFVVSGRAGIVHRRGEMVGSRCYTVCPPVIYPTGHDPYYESSYFTLERELHGGPFGPGTLNPFNTNDPRNYVPRVAPHPFGQKLFSYAPPRNPMNPMGMAQRLSRRPFVALDHVFNFFSVAQSSPNEYLFTFPTTDPARPAVPFSNFDPGT